MFTALWLAEEGIRVQIIDQQPGTTTRSYACAMHPRTLDLLAQAGIGAEVATTGRRIDTVAFYEGGTRRAVLNLADLPGAFPYLLVLDQSRLEELLERKLKQLGNVYVNWNHRLADLRQEGGGVTATVERLTQSGKGYSVPGFDWVVGRRSTVVADYVVGADGNHSIVRQRLAIP